MDFFRGLGFVLMFMQHTVFDLRHVFGLDFFPFQDTVWFMDWIRPVILVLILLVSGISCTFSRNNFKRAGQTALYALGVTLAFELISYFLQMEMHVYFNVFHLVAVSVFFYALLAKAEDHIPQDPRKDWRSLLLFILGAIVLYLGTAAAKSPYLSHNNLLFLGLYSRDVPSMADYLPMFPWFGMFLIGAGIGRIFYRTRKTLLSEKHVSRLAKWGRPLNFIGRHPLLIYAVHQPIILGILWLILTLTGVIG